MFQVSRVTLGASKNVKFRLSWNSTKFNYRFTLSQKIEFSRVLQVFVGARGKVGSHNKGYMWVPKSRGFVKLQEVGNFRTWNTFILKAM